MLDSYLEKGAIEAAWDLVRNRLFLEKTCLIYDEVIENEADFPTPDETKRAWPNPCGYGCGMDDTSINAGTMIDACLCRYELDGSAEAADFAHMIARGMIENARAAKTEGFIPRGRTPIDCKSHYPDSSIDQYTMYIFGAHRWLNSTLCTKDERDAFAEILASVARRAKKNVKEENGYDMLSDDGKPTLVSKFWRGKIGNHAFFRLPEVYAAAYEATGDREWLDAYLSLRDEAYERSLPMTSYWHLYCLQQMQCSLAVCRDVDPDAEWKEKYRSLMETVADYALGEVKKLRAKLLMLEDINLPYVPFRSLPLVPQRGFVAMGIEAYSPKKTDTDTFFTTQDPACIAIVCGLVSKDKMTEDAERLFAETLAMFDYNVYGRSAPVHFLEGYYRNK